jgi:hypothetical protein
MTSTTSKLELLACVLLGLGAIVRVPMAISGIFCLCVLQILVNSDDFEDCVRKVWSWGLSGSVEY